MASRKTGKAGAKRKPAKTAAAKKKAAKTAKAKPSRAKNPSRAKASKASAAKKAKAAAGKKTKAKAKPSAAKKPPTKKPADKKQKPSATKTATTKVATKTAKPQKPAAPTYTPNASERYMSQRQKRYFREVLKAMLTSIRVNSEKTIDSLKDDVAAIPDDNDRASKEAEFTLELRERERERRLKQKIDHAIRRIDKGEFGLCEECGEPIGIERLVARPVAVYCFECKQLQERREKTGN